MNRKSKPIDEATLRQLAVKADCDPRTIEKVLKGVPVRGMAGRRAARAVFEAGLKRTPTRSAEVVTSGGRP